MFPPKEIAPAPKAKAVTILSKPPFVVNIFQWQVPSEGSEGELMSRGTMHSKIFDGTDASLVTLAGLRKKIAAVTSMSTGSKIHKFCTSKGVTVADETMTFADYLQMEDTDAPENATLPSVMVAYKLNSNINQPKVDMSTLPGAPNTIKADHEVDILP